MLNGAIAALVAITAACAFVAPWAAIVIGFVAGVIVVLGVAARRARRHRRPDRRGRRARHGRASGARSRSGSSPLPELADEARDGPGGLFYGGGFHQLGVQALGLVAVGAFTFTASFLRPLADEDDGRDPHRAARSRRRASTCPSTACGATPSSTSRSPAATAPSTTRVTGSGRRLRRRLPRQLRRRGRGSVALWEPRSGSHSARVSAARRRR